MNMSNIQENLKKIREAFYGKEVRQAIHDSIHDCYEDGKSGATDLIARERLDVVENNKADNTALEDEKNQRIAAITQERNERQKEINVERERIDNLTKLQDGSTTGDAELADIRVGADGKTYENAGEAVRGQVIGLKEYLSKVKSDISTDIFVKLDFYTIKGFINFRNGNYVEISDVETYWCTDFISCKSGDEFIVTTGYYGDVCGVAFYDSDKKFISAALHDEEATFTNPADAIHEKIIVPQNSHYVRFSNYKQNVKKSDLIVLYKKPINENVNDISSFQVDGYNGEYVNVNNALPIFYGEYFTENGNHIKLSDCDFTDIIDIDNFKYNVMYVNAYSIFETTIYLLYDAEKKVIDYFSHKKFGLDEFYAENMKVDFEEIKKTTPNAKYIRLCSYDYTIGGIHKGTKLNVNLHNVSCENILRGKKWVACGDSFTEGGYIAEGKDSKNFDYQTNMFKTYPWVIGRRNDMVIVNEAKSGTCIALNKDHLDDPSYNNPFSYERYKNIPKDADYITLSFGINDCWACNLGTINDTTNATFYGAWNIVLEHLYNNHPNAKIGIINFGSNLEKGKDFRTAIREISKKWGIPCMDYMNDPNIPVMLYGREDYFNLSDIAFAAVKKKFYISSENAHPNLEADKYQSTFIEMFLRSL